MTDEPVRNLYEVFIILPGDEALPPYCVVEKSPEGAQLIALAKADIPDLCDMFRVRLMTRLVGPIQNDPGNYAGSAQQRWARNALRELKDSLKED